MAEEEVEFYAGDELVAYMEHYGVEPVECSRCAAPAPLLAASADRLFLAARRGLEADTMRAFWLRDAMLMEWGIVKVLNPSAVLACPGCSKPAEVKRTLTELYLVAAQTEYAWGSGSQN
ncbi:MAG TPA: hypothetical protein VHF88_07680 [Thermoleophilaceae bacterium]|nr:hypothetical protein [Thermoleophilaceae bacterium]